MFAKFFNAPSAADEGLQANFLFATEQLISFSYTERFTKTGEFKLTLPYSNELLTKISTNRIVNVGDAWLHINDVHRGGRKVTLSGKDLKSLLELRISAPDPSGVQGYDSITGTTAECITHYLNANAVNPTDAVRVLPFTIAGGGASGLANDSYMSKFEYLSDIVYKLCENAHIGYTIVGDKIANDIKLRFKLLSGTNRTSSVVLSQRRGTLLDMAYETSISNELNAIYAESNGTVQFVDRYNPDDPSSQGAAGIYRRECKVDVSAALSDVPKYAVYQTENNVQIYTYNLSASASCGYGSKFYLGDTVTIRDDDTGGAFPAQIVEAVTEYTNGGRRVSLAIGKVKPKLLNRVASNIVNGTIRGG